MTRAECVRQDAPSLPRSAAMLAWLVLASCAHVRAADSGPASVAGFAPLAARVASVRDSLLYVSASDSGAISAGMTLVLERGRKTVATARVTRLVDARLAEARLTSGSLAGERRLERLRVLGEPAHPVRPPLLRVGLPGPHRASLLFACDAPLLRPRLGPATYARDSLAPDAGRWLRLASVAGLGAIDPAEASAPDTLIVRFYAEATDQEIALERGEIDVGVFWPGELSARMRSDARWRDPELGLRSRGVLAVIDSSSDSIPAPPEALAALNREAFAGDLEPWGELEPGLEGAPRAPAARVVVDPALPGSRLIERVLARAATGPPARTLRLAYLDVPVAARDAAQSRWRTRGVSPVFALRCAVVAAPQARPVVRALSPGAFADLVSCDAGSP